MAGALEMLRAAAKLGNILYRFQMLHIGVLALGLAGARGMQILRVDSEKLVYSQESISSNIKLKPNNCENGPRAFWFSSCSLHSRAVLSVKVSHSPGSLISMCFFGQLQCRERQPWVYTHW